MYKVAYRNKNNVKRTYETREEAERYIYYLYMKGYSETIYLLNENDEIIFTW